MVRHPSELCLLHSWDPSHRALEKIEGGGFVGGPVAKIPCSQSRGPRFNPWAGTRYHRLQLRVHMSQLKILLAATKIEDLECYN